MSPEHDSKDEGTGFETSAELRHGDTFPPMRDYRPPPAPAPSRVLWVAPFVCLGSTRDGSSCSARSASCVCPRSRSRFRIVSCQSPRNLPSVARRSSSVERVAHPPDSPRNPAREAGFPNSEASKGTAGSRAPRRPALDSRHGGARCRRRRDQPRGPCRAAHPSLFSA